MERIWLLCSLIVALALAACQPITAPLGQTGAAAGTYVDPNGRFTVPVPATWTATSEQGYAVLRSPTGKIEIYLLVLEGVALEDAVAQAWRIVDPAFDLTPQVIEETPSRTGVTRTLAYDYDTGEGQMVQGRAEALGDLVYLTLMRGEVIELEQRLAQLDIILSGLALSGIVAVDLRGVTPQTLTPGLLEEFGAYIEDALVRFDVPGAAIAVVQGDEVVFLEGFGVAERGRDAPITPQTRLMIGSVNKTITTLLMAQLVDEGIMAWDTPVQTILPQFAVADPEISTRMTIRHLVCACSGVPRRDLEFFFHANQLSAEQVIDSLRTFEFFTGFGEAYQYSNQLVATGGWVAAAAAGGKYGDLDKAYLELIEERVFDPIGMENTTFSIEEVLASDNYATPHRLSTMGERAPLPVDADRLLLGIAPAGAAWSTAEDMARYLRAELSQGVAPNGTRVVSAQQLRETWQPQVAVNATTQYGLGWFVDSYKGQPMLHHGGNTSGFSTELAFLPEADLGVVVMTNGRLTNAFNQAVVYRLFELAFDQAQEYDSLATFIHDQTLERSLAPVADAVAVDPALVSPYLGRYTNAALGEVILKLEEETLILDSGELAMEVQALVDETGATSGYVIHSYIGPVLGLPVQLTNDEAGSPVLLLGQDVVQYRFSPVR